MSSKTRLIPAWIGYLLAKIIENFAGRIANLVNSPALRAGALALFLRVKAMALAVSDDNPENASQLEEILGKFISEDAIPLADGVIDERIARIPNERVRRGLSLLAEPIVDTMRLLSDDNPDNAQQAEDVLDAFILKPETEAFVLTDLTIPILENVVKDDFLRGFILEAIEQGLEEGLEQLADVDVFTRQRTIEAVQEARQRAIQRSAA